jgi:chemotaxis protein MotB
MTPEGNVKIDNSNGKNKAIPVAAPETVAAGQLPVIASAPQLVATQQAKPESETILPALPVEQEFKPIPLEQHAQPEPQPAPPIQPIDAEQELQADLSKTIQEFGLNDAVHIKVKQGYAQLEIQDKVLFKSSQADLTPDGAAVLTRLTPLLKQAEGLILIEGHTDNLPINTVQFPSNWELGSSRATSVLHFLTSQQLESSRMRAMTYADTQPIADNATSAGREKNRRVSILIKVADQQRQSDAE